MAAALALPLAAAAAAERPGVPPEDPWTCPLAHPIKGYVSQETGRRVYFVPGGRAYADASPERCYASEDEARRDGSRPARDPQPLPPSGEVAARPTRGIRVAAAASVSVRPGRGGASPGAR